MENASKALLIAAAVLIVIIIIAVGMKIFSSTLGVQKVGLDTGDTLSKKTSEATSLAIDEITNLQKAKDLKEGEHVWYTDNSNNLIESVVLYNNEEYGVQIITNDIISEYIVNSNTNRSISDLSSEWRRYSEVKGLFYSQIDNKLIKKCRAVGSNPYDGYVWTGNRITVNGYEFYNDDNSLYQYDIEQMRRCNTLNIGKKYLLASRIIESEQLGYTTYYNLYYREINESGNLDKAEFVYRMYYYNTKPKCNYSTSGLRAIFILNENVKVVEKDGKKILAN